MVPRIEVISPKFLVGMRVRMSFADNKTGQLFGRFMPRRREIVGCMTDDIFCLQKYPENFDFQNFDPTAEFEKWAAVEVAEGDAVPYEMETFVIPGGMYAVFDHRGGPAAAERTFGYIFGTWLPASGYSIDNRPHFEIIGEKYGDGGPDSEEEVWIPIKSDE
jgi:AraC family transcriptional regulator